jgi:hypothetical protein
MEKWYWWILVINAFCLGADGFILTSELRTNFSDDGSAASFFTGYTYDVNGNRVSQRIWNGADSSTVPMSRAQYSSAANGLVTEALQLSGADTQSIVRYAYDGNKLVAVRTLAKDGSMRFTDSIIYDNRGRDIEEQRISSTGVKTYYHHYTLNDFNKTTADTMYELVSSSYTATQAALLTYNADSTAATEARWRKSGDNWYCISTVYMAYSGKKLASITTHERDNAEGAMTDSLAYTYDANGNRSKEEEYDGTKTLIRRIVYTWRNLQPIIAVLSPKPRSDGRFVITLENDRLILNYLPDNHCEFSLFDMAGRCISKSIVDHAGDAPLHNKIGKGSYVAVFTCKSEKKVINFTKYN